MEPFLVDIHQTKSKDTQKINQKTTKLLLTFLLDALALLRVIMTNIQENSQIYRLCSFIQSNTVGVNCHMGIIGTQGQIFQSVGSPLFMQLI